MRIPLCAVSRSSVTPRCNAATPRRAGFTSTTITHVKPDCVLLIGCVFEGHANTAHRTLSSLQRNDLALVRVSECQCGTEVKYTHTTRTTCTQQQRLEVHGLAECVRCMRFHLVRGSPSSTNRIPSNRVGARLIEGGGNPRLLITSVDASSRGHHQQQMPRAVKRSAQLTIDCIQ